MARIVIIGHTGVVGTALHRAAAREGHEVTGLSRSTGFELATDSPSLEGVKAVFLCAALTNVDECERNPPASRSLNVDAPARIAEECARAGARLVFYSTDYVFDGAAGPYDENALPHPINVYGRDKLAAERAIAGILPATHAIIRTTVVFGPEHARKNFVIRLHDRLRAGETVLVPDDQLGTPTWSADLAGASLDVLREDVPGVLHIAGATRASRYDFAVRAAEILGLDATLIRRCDTPSLGQPARRPLEAGLVSVRLKRRMATMDEGLRAFAEELGAP